MNIDKEEVSNFNAKINKGVKSLQLEAGFFIRNTKEILFAKAPLILKYSLNESEAVNSSITPTNGDYYVYLCID
jgi:hypothetical protein